MQEEFVKYNGKMIPKKGFRVYIYSRSLEKKLVNSWDEFESHVATGLWFVEKPLPPVKRTRKRAK